jgi:hypothetical protein
MTEEKRLEQRQRVADALGDVLEVARLNDVGPLSFSELMMSVSASLYRNGGKDKQTFLRMAEHLFDTNVKSAPLYNTTH